MSKTDIQKNAWECIGKTNVDLNSLTNPGVYYCVNDNDGDYNFPGTSISGILYVSGPASKSYTRQIFYRVGTVDQNDFQWYTRQIKSDGTVGEWKMILSEENKYDTMKTGEEIPANADLNNYTTAGVYTSFDSDNTATIKNKPSGVTTGFRMEIINTTTNVNWFKQIIHPNVDSQIMWIRQHGEDWSDWYKIINEDIIDSKFNTTNIQSYSNLGITKSNVNLNSLTDPGVYYCSLTDVSTNTQYNYPTGSNCILLVLKANTSGSFVRQIFFRCGTVNTNDYQWYSRQIRLNTDPITVGDWVRIANEKDIDDLKSSFQDGVDTLYNKCKSRGATPSAKTPTAIATAIDKIANNVTITSLGGSTSINVKTKLPNDYSRLTKNNFIVELVKIVADGGARNVEDSIYPQFGVIDANATMSKSYNASTGILTISGIECHAQSQTTGWVRYVNGYATVNVYAVY